MTHSTDTYNLLVLKLCWKYVLVHFCRYSYQLIASKEQCGYTDICALYCYFFTYYLRPVFTYHVCNDFVVLFKCIHRNINILIVESDPHNSPGDWWHVKWYIRSLLNFIVPNLKIISYINVVFFFR